LDKAVRLILCVREIKLLKKVYKSCKFLAIMKILQIIVFLIIKLLLLPLSIIGYIVFVFKIMVYGKKRDIPVTSTNPLFAHWILHKFRLRKDEDGAKIISSLPFISGAGFWLMMEPSIIANRICGYIPSLAKIHEPEKASIASFDNCKTEFFDKIMEKNINRIDYLY